MLLVPMIGVLLLLQAPALGNVPAGRLDRTQAEAFTRKMDQIQAITRRPADRRLPATVPITEGELNSYFLYTPDSMPKGVTAMSFRFEPGRLVAHGVVDIDLLKPKVGLSPWNPIAWMSGNVPVDVEGRVTSRDGTATVVWEDVRVSSVSVSPSLLRQMVATATRGSERFPNGLDILAPFELPYEARRVRFELARALVDF